MHASSADRATFGAIWLPSQEELDRFDDTLGTERLLREEIEAAWLDWKEAA